MLDFINCILLLFLIGMQAAAYKEQMKAINEIVGRLRRLDAETGKK